MPHVQTRITKEIWNVRKRLIEIGTSLEKLHEIRLIAIAAAREATSFHPANAFGTLAYQHGTWAMRDKHVDDIWQKDTEHGVEAILNRSTNIRMIFCNVDCVCDDNRQPKPRSQKGAGSERACSGNLFGDLPTYAPFSEDGVATFYIMMDQEGNAEFSRPVVKGSTFTTSIERIYLPAEIDETRELDSKPVDKVFDVEPLVARKK